MQHSIVGKGEKSLMKIEDWYLDLIYDNSVYSGAEFKSFFVAELGKRFKILISFY